MSDFGGFIPEWEPPDLSGRSLEQLQQQLNSLIDRRERAMQELSTLPELLRDPGLSPERIYLLETRILDQRLLLVGIDREIRHYSTIAYERAAAYTVGQQPPPQTQRERLRAFAERQGMRARFALTEAEFRQLEVRFSRPPTPEVIRGQIGHMLLEEARADLSAIAGRQLSYDQVIRILRQEANKTGLGALSRNQSVATQRITNLITGDSMPSPIPIREQLGFRSRATASHYRDAAARAVQQVEFRTRAQVAHTVERVREDFGFSYQRLVHSGAVLRSQGALHQAGEWANTYHGRQMIHAGARTGVGAGLILANRQQIATLSRQTVRGVTRVWDGLLRTGGRKALERDFVRITTPMILGAQEQSVRMTDSFLSNYVSQRGEFTQVGTLDPNQFIGFRARNGEFIEEAYGKHVVSYRYMGDDARARVVQDVRTDLHQSQLLSSYAFMEDGRANVVGFARVPEHDACDFCLMASTQRYHRGDLMPIHPNCQCFPIPLIGDRDPGQVINSKRLERLKAGGSRLETKPDGRLGRSFDYRKSEMNRLEQELEDEFEREMERSRQASQGREDRLRGRDYARLGLSGIYNAWNYGRTREAIQNYRDPQVWQDLVKRNGRWEPTEALTNHIQQVYSSSNDQHTAVVERIVVQQGTMLERDEYTFLFNAGAEILKDAIASGMEVASRVAGEQGWVPPQLQSVLSTISDKMSSRSLMGSVSYLVDGSIANAAGENIGGFTNVINPRTLEVFHSLLRLDEGYQGSGITPAMQTQWGMAYVASGIRSIGAYAGLEVGGYAWASRGFNWRFPNIPSAGPVARMWRVAQGDDRAFATAVDAGLNHTPLRSTTELAPFIRDQDRDQLNAMLSGILRGRTFKPQDVIGIGRDNPFEIDGHRTWLGKEIMLGSEWGAMLDLDEVRRQIDLHNNNN